MKTLKQYLATLHYDIPDDAHYDAAVRVIKQVYDDAETDIQQARSDGYDDGYIDGCDTARDQ